MPVEAKKKRPTKSTAKSFEELLLELNLDELRGFIRHENEIDGDFGERLRLFFLEKDPQTDPAKVYGKMVRQLVKKHSDREFMHYRSTFAFCKDLYPLLQNAHHAVARNKLREAMAIAQVTCVAAMGVLTHCDDSAGNIGDLVQESIKVMRDTATSASVTNTLVEDIFAWIEHHLQDSVWFSYGDFGDQLLEVAQSIAKVDAERFVRLLDEVLAARTSTGTRDDYTRQALTKRKIDYLQAIGRTSEAEQLIEGHLEFSAVRRGAVEKAIEQGNFARAKQLIADGIEMAEGKGVPGLVRQWEQARVRVAEMENDTPTLRLLSHKLAFDRVMDRTFYLKWKASFSQEEWPEVIEQYIQSVIAKENTQPRRAQWDSGEYQLFSRLSPIFIEEGQWQRLLQIIPADASEHTLEIVRPHLATRYPNELLAMYVDTFREMAAQAGDRKNYRALATLMKQVKEAIPGSELAINELAKSLIQTYPQRPAMRDELGKISKAKTTGVPTRV